MAEQRDFAVQRQSVASPGAVVRLPAMQDIQPYVKGNMQRYIFTPLYKPHKRQGHGSVYR